MADTRQAADPTFVGELRRVLNSLYDWSLLHRSPFLQLFGTEQKDDPPAALRRILTDAIEALKPCAQVPAKARGWRTYRLLRSRFTEQFSQVEVASELGLSIRHLRRQESLALQTLAAYLWSRYELDRKWQCPEEIPRPAEALATPANVETPSQEQELEWLQESSPSQPVAAGEAIQAALRLVEPMGRALRVEVDASLPQSLPPLLVQLTLVRQALVSLFTAAIASAPGGRISVRVQGERSCVTIRVQVCTMTAPGKEGTERLTMARRLFEAAGGRMEAPRDWSAGAHVQLVVALPTEEQTPVLVIEDNLDTLRLLERALSHSRYAFRGTTDPAQALQLACEVHPRAIILDVMLPQSDGWELLGRLREHPTTRGTPVIICTILPQADLARNLGAASFLRKPVSRQAILAALDRLLAPAAPECG